MWETAPPVTGPTSSLRPFSTDEFARLIVLLETYDDIHSALKSTGIGLSRLELDRGANRAEFWKYKVEAVFNDATFRPSCPFEGAIRDVYCPVLTLHYHKGDDLKRH